MWQIENFNTKGNNSIMSAKSVIKFVYFDFLSKDIYNNICDFGVLSNFENPAESLHDGPVNLVS